MPMPPDPIVSRSLCIDLEVGVADGRIHHCAAVPRGRTARRRWPPCTACSPAAAAGRTPPSCSPRRALFGRFEPGNARRQQLGEQFSEMPKLDQRRRRVVGEVALGQRGKVGKAPVVRGHEGEVG